MKNFLLLFLTSILTTHFIYSQPDEKPQTIKDLVWLEMDTTKTVANIEKIKDEIKNNIGSYQQAKEAENSDGYRYVYRKGKELKLVSISFKDKDYNKNVEWYFANDELIYSQQMWSDLKTDKIIVDNEKFYLYHEHLIRWTKGGKEVNTKSEEFINVENDLPAYGEELIKKENK